MVKHELNPGHENKIMARIVISDLYPIDVEPFLYELALTQIQNLLGGNINIQIIAINYGFNPLLNIIKAPYSVYDNRANSTNDTRQVIVGSFPGY